MLEVRFVKNTGELTAWCGDERQFGSLDRGRDTEAIVELDVPFPDKPLGAWLFDEASQALIPNPGYIPPVVDYETTPDYLRACEILSQSPPVMTMIEVWELLRIIGKRLGYRFEE